LRMDRENLAHPTGFEPVTFGIGIQHSIQLSYGCLDSSLAQHAAAFNGKSRREARLGG
jgi:hypothetical protein